MRTCSSYAVGNARTGSNPVSTVPPTPYVVVCSWYFDRVVKVLHLKTYFTVFKPIICIFILYGHVPCKVWTKSDDGGCGRREVKD